MRDVSDKSCGEKHNTHFTFNNFLSDSCAIYEIMWKNMVEPDGVQTVILYYCSKTQ